MFLFYTGPKFTITNFNYILLLFFYILIITSILKYNKNKFIYKYIIKKNIDPCIGTGTMLVVIERSF